MDSSEAAVKWKKWLNYEIRWLIVKDITAAINLLNAAHWYTIVSMCLCVHSFRHFEYLSTLSFYQNNFNTFVLQMTDTICSLVIWGWKMHLLHLFMQKVRPLPTQKVPWISHLTLWWCGSSNFGTLGNAEYSFITIAHRFILAPSGSTW